MIRTLMTILACLTIGIALTGCEQSDPDTEQMSKKRSPPTEKRAAPGSGLGLSSETEEAEEPPAGGGD